MDLSGKSIGFAFTGSFCTFNKTIEELKKIKKYKKYHYNSNNEF